MNILSETVEQKMNSVINKYFAKIKDDVIYLYQGSIQDYTWKRTVIDKNKTLRSHYFMGKKNYGNIVVVFHPLWLMKKISKIEQSSESIILESLIMHIQSIVTIYPNPIYLKNHVTYHA